MRTMDLLEVLPRKCSASPLFRTLVACILTRPSLLIAVLAFFNECSISCLGNPGSRHSWLMCHCPLIKSVIIELNGLFFVQLSIKFLEAH